MRSRCLTAAFAAPAVVIALALAVQPSAAATTIVSESAVPSSADGITFSVTIDPHGEASGAQVAFEWGNSEYTTPPFQAEETPVSHTFPSGRGVKLQSVSFPYGDESDQTVSYTDPSALDEAFTLRWPDGPLKWVDEDNEENELWRWQRPSPTETIHYRAVVLDAPGTIYGPDQTLTSTAPKAAPSVSTGPAQVKQAGAHRYVYFSGTLNEHEQGYAWYAFEFGPTKSYGHICAAGNPIQPYWLALEKTAYGGEELVDAPTSNAPHPISWACMMVDAPDSKAANDATPGATYHYRLVADNGYGSGPVYGQDQTVTIPGAKPASGKGSSPRKHSHGKQPKRKRAKGRHSKHAAKG